MIQLGNNWYKKKSNKDMEWKDGEDWIYLIIKLSLNNWYLVIKKKDMQASTHSCPSIIKKNSKTKIFK